MFANAKMRAAIAVSLGAIAGALCRHYISQVLMHLLGSTFPWGTLGVNLSGCWLLGAVTVWLNHRGPQQPEIVLLLTTGFLGAYTTFSAYELDLVSLVDRPSLISDLIYGFGSLLLGLGCLGLGMLTATVIWSRPHRDRSSID